MTNDEKQLEKLNDLYKRVQVNAGVLTVSMRDLKELDGRKLGKNVRKDIASLLEKGALGFVGAGESFDELPNHETGTVRIYIKSSQIGSLIGAVIVPGAAGDRRLRAMITSDDAQVRSKLLDLINGLRELIAAHSPTDP